MILFIEFYFGTLTLFFLQIFPSQENLHKNKLSNFDKLPFLNDKNAKHPTAFSLYNCQFYHPKSVLSSQKHNCITKLMEVMLTIGLVTRFFRKRVLCGASSAVLEFACKRKEKEEIESRYFLLKHDSC